MSDEALGPLIGKTLRIGNKEQLDELLTSPDARASVEAASFEQVFFTVRALGLADSLELLPLVTPAQTRGFIDLDCWRKDAFARKPFMEWIAAFVQIGPETVSRALEGIDEFVVALFLKELIEVFEIDRDEPPPATELTFSPDNRFAMRQTESGDAATIAALILDVLFRFNPDLGYSILRRLRYTSRIELEETAYQNKLRRLDVHGFVDYYEALSIYAGPEGTETVAVPRAEAVTEEIPGEEPPQFLPTVFAESLSGSGFLLAALGDVPAAESERLAGELTALGNRILSANLINLGEVEGIRMALVEMRDYLTIGLEFLSGRDEGSAPGVLASNYTQNVFKAGFDKLARLRDQAEQLAGFPAFSPGLLEDADREFLTGVRRFKPLLWHEGTYRNFETLEEVKDAGHRLKELRTMAEGFLRLFATTDTSLRKAFNTALIRKAVTGEFTPAPLEASMVEKFIAGGLDVPVLELPPELEPFARRWATQLLEELRPLAGKKVDPRFIDSVSIRL